MFPATASGSEAGPLPAPTTTSSWASAGRQRATTSRSRTATPSQVSSRSASAVPQPPPGGSHATTEPGPSGDAASVVPHRRDRELGTTANIDDNDAASSSTDLPEHSAPGRPRKRRRLNASGDGAPVHDFSAPPLMQTYEEHDGATPGPSEFSLGPGLRAMQLLSRTPTQVQGFATADVEVLPDLSRPAINIDAIGQEDMPATNTNEAVLPPSSPPAPPAPATRRMEPEPLSSYQCPICFTPPSYPTLTPCGHICCGECLFTAVKSTIARAAYHGPASQRAKCPVCRAPIPGWDGKGRGVIGLTPRVQYIIEGGR